MVEKVKENRSNFFKIMHGDLVNNLRIPPVFVKNVFKGNVPTNFTLESDSGLRGSWRVRVQRKERGFFFCGGWSSFVKDHRLEYGDFLHFFLLDGSRFYVVICGLTACSKYISFSANGPSGQAVVNRQIEQEKSKGFASCSKVARRISSSPRVSGSIVKRARNFWKKIENQHLISCQLILKGYNNYSIPVPKSFANETGLAKEESTVIKDPKGREWPINILLDGNTNMVRLGGGWSKFLQENEIVVGDTLLFKGIPNTGNPIHVQIISQVGDGNIGRQNKRPNACQINTSPAAKRPRGRPVVNRQIEETPRTKRVSAGWARKGREKIEFVSEVISEHPSFEVVFKEYHKRQRYVVVPKSFADEIGLAEEKIMVIKDPNGRIWPVNAVVGSGRTTLGVGWCKYVRENKIVVGDTLLFKYIRNPGNLIDVQVIKKATDENSGSRKKRPNACQMNTSLTAKSRRGRPIVNKQIEETPTMKCASSFKLVRGVSCGCARTRREGNGSEEIEFISEENPEHPSFIVVLKEHQKRCLTVPSSFAKELGWVKKQSTAIMDPEGRKWQLNVRLISESSTSADLRVRLVGGWPKFLRENKIVVGDILLIEHIPNTGNLIHFKIISKARRRNERK